MKKDLTLLIMAAGMGSRFGGLKQVEPIGPNKEFILDYSIYDAIEAGFTKVVFVIKKENYTIFKETVGSRIENKIKVEYVFQDISDLPEGVNISPSREKPWGTAHAIWSARNVINEPFVVINADDFYGRDPFMKLAHYLQTEKEDEYAMVGFQTANTLSDTGYVNRGVAEIENGFLKNVQECKVERIKTDIIATPHDGSQKFKVTDDTLVSMNTWGFYSNLFEILEKEFIAFLNENKNCIEKCEYFIPTVIQKRIDHNNLKVKVLSTNSKWHGVTYREELENIKKEILGYIEQRIYPNKLW